MKSLLACLVLLLVSSCSTLESPTTFTSIGHCRISDCNSMTIHEHIVFNNY